MLTEILVASLSGIIAVLIAAIAYIQAKRLLFFKLFLKEKQMFLKIILSQ